MADVSKGNCRSCGAAILWVVMAATGKRMPLDPKPQKRVVLDAHESAPGAAVVDAYTSHFSTCPHAAQHRKEKAG